MSTPTNPFSLADWRRTVAELYADVRSTSPENPVRAAEHFRARRDRLFMEHADSPIAPERRARWRRASWYAYDPAWRIRGTVQLVDAVSTFDIPLASDGILRCARVATVRFVASGVTANLAVYWLCGYGGGLWLPFADASNGRGTYAGGRYLYDTIKGADLGATSRELLLDFNYAYNPSCAYDDCWACPLSPPDNRLPFAIEAGERAPAS